MSRPKTIDEDDAVAHEETEAPFAIGPVAVPKASDVLADHLREQILSGNLAEGSALPVERELASAVGLSRGTVRDALRVLEVEGLINTRPGRAGGSFVRRPDATTLQRSLSALMSSRGVRFSSLLEMRGALEPAAAGLAAVHRTEKDLARLDTISERLRAAVPHDIPQFLQHNIDWHVAIVAASHNEIMQIVLESLSRAILAATDNAEFNNERTMTDTIVAHDKILAAIRAGDAQKASAAMGKHVHGYRVLIEGFEHPVQLPL